MCMAMPSETVAIPHSELLCIGEWADQPYQLSRAKKPWGFSDYLNQYFWTHKQYYDFKFSSLQDHKEDTHHLILQDIHGSWAACLLFLFCSACSPEHWHCAICFMRYWGLKENIQVQFASIRPLLNNSERWADVQRLKFRKRIWRSKRIWACEELIFSYPTW